MDTIILFIFFWANNSEFEKQCEDIALFRIIGIINSGCTSSSPSFINILGESSMWCIVFSRFWMLMSALIIHLSVLIVIANMLYKLDTRCNATIGYNIDKVLQIYYTYYFG